MIKSKQIEGRGELAIIILAAGSSSRMGQPKQQLLIGEKALLVHTVDTAIESGVREVFVVLGCQKEEHQELLKNKSVEAVFNPQWQAGIGSSLKFGLKHVLSKKPQTEAVIVMVCDQPLVTARSIESLVESYRKTNLFIVASSYSNIKGVPALFDRKLFDELLNLNDDEGAKRIIQQHAGVAIDFRDGAIDLDTPEDYKRWLGH
jgi:molybdenum cofactor cytidylyltransferase